MNQNSVETQTPEKNPFRPGVGTRPLHLAGRDAEIRRLRSTLRASPEIPGNIRLTGLRGVGKTVLLAEYKRVAEQDGWVTIDLELEPRHNRDDALAELLDQACRVRRERLTRLSKIRAKVGKTVQRNVGKLGVAYGDISFTVEPRTESRLDDLGHTLYDTVEAAVSRGYQGFGLLLDEAQVLRDDRKREGEHPLSLLIASVSGLQKAELPISLVLCGLPTLVGNLLAARTYTERMFRGEQIGSLDPEAAREAFVRPLASTSIEADERLVQRAVESVEGYPYYIQLWGAELFDAAVGAGISALTLPLLEEVEPEIYRRLDIDFYDPRIQTLTPAEQDVLLASARCSYPPLLVSELNRLSDKSPGNVNVLLGRLVQAGVLYRMRKGQYGYTAPKFHEYLRRRIEARDA